MKSCIQQPKSATLGTKSFLAVTAVEHAIIWSFKCAKIATWFVYFCPKSNAAIMLTYTKFDLDGLVVIWAGNTSCRLEFMKGSEMSRYCNLSEFSHLVCFSLRTWVHKFNTCRQWRKDPAVLYWGWDLTGDSYLNSFIVSRVAQVCNGETSFFSYPESERRNISFKDWIFCQQKLQTLKWPLCSV